MGEVNKWIHLVEGSAQLRVRLLVMRHGYAPFRRPRGCIDAPRSKSPSATLYTIGSLARPSAVSSSGRRSLRSIARSSSPSVARR